MKDIIGLAVLAWPLTLGVLILLAFAIAISLATRYAKRTGRSKWRWALLGFLVVYLPIFWDWIPTVVMHKYYCSTEAGFWVYKSLEQWKQENPGVMETLHQTLQPNQKTPYGDVDILDERFAIETHRRQPIQLLTLNISETRLVDRKTGEILEKAVDVGSGIGSMATGGGLKFWLNQKPCVAMEFWKFTAQLEKMRGQK